MKNNLPKTLSQYIVVGSLLLLLGCFSVSEVAAQTGSPSAEATPTGVQDVTYTLPYPGLLPNNPLYVFKVVRDRVVGFFISDPGKKATFDLLQADKRISAAQSLNPKDPSQVNLIISTVSKAENYFDEALGQLRAAKEAGEDIHPQLTQMESAAKKHEQVIKDLRVISPKLQKELVRDTQRVSGFETEVKKLAQ